MAKIVGITGGIGSGKTTITKFFEAFNDVAIYIADIEAKKLMVSSKNIKTKITTAFGAEAYKNNELNSAYISTIVFNNKEKLTVLNSIVHPEVKKHFKEFVLANKSKKYILYENAILFETKSNLMCHIVIGVFVPLKERIQRVVKRDNVLLETVLARINSQWLEDKKLLQLNYIIYNTTLESAKNQVTKIHNILTKTPISV